MTNSVAHPRAWAEAMLRGLEAAEAALTARAERADAAAAEVRADVRQD